MKKLFLLAAAAIMVVSAGAQEKKFWVGGTLGLSQTDIYSSPSTYLSSINVLPEFGYKFNDRWAAGIQLGFAQAKINAPSSSYGSMQTFSVAPFARYTWFNWRALSLFADGGIDFSSADGRVSADGSKIDYANVLNCGLFVNPGFSVRVYKNIALEGRTNLNLFTAGYSEADVHTANGGDTDIWHFSLNPEFSPKSLVNSITLGLVFEF